MDINLNSSPVVVGDNKHRHEKVTQVTFSQPNCPLNRTSDPDVLTTITSNGFYEDSSQIISTNVAISHEIITNDVDPSSSSIFANLEEHEDYLCGLGSFRPKWSQCLANKQSFLTMFCLTSVLQGMYYTYFVSVLTTIEKLFQIQSKTTGILMSATEIGQIGGALLLSYYGGQGDRPKWISGGMLIFAFASLICSTPHFLFGGQSLLSNMASMSPSSSNQQSSSNFGRGDFSQSLCLDSNHNFSSLSANLSTFVLQDSNHPSVVYSKCEDNDLKTAQSQITSWVLGIFFLSLFLIGIGTTAVNTLGIPYIDDNVASRESPLYMGITIGVRIFGPVLGFLLGSICTSIYVDFPFANFSGLTPSDPQWIGCWWLGVFIVGFSLVLVSFPMMAFPKKLPRPDPSSYCHKLQQQQIILQDDLEKKTEVSNGSPASLTSMTSKRKQHRPSLRDFPSAVARLVKNRILLYRTASSVLHILPIAGLYTFLPKYLESQFQLTAAEANMISGIAGILVMGAGIFASGIFMRKFKPSSRFVAAWIAIAALLYAAGMVVLMFLGCPMNDVVGVSRVHESDSLFSTTASPIDNDCSFSCSCPIGEYSPICTSEGKTFISPCLAGCSSVATVNLTYSFSDCKCLSSGVKAVNGNCDLDCNNLVWYIVIFSVTVLIHSTSEVGSMLLTLRCVQPQDKAMALGLVSFSIGLFGNVPCPIVYGAVVDSACLFWEKTCGEDGACRVYDSDRFRFAFHGVTAIIMFVAFVVDAVVWFEAPGIKFDDEDEKEEKIRLHYPTTKTEESPTAGNEGDQSFKSESSL